MSKMEEHYLFQFYVLLTMHPCIILYIKPNGTILFLTVHPCIILYIKPNGTTLLIPILCFVDRPSLYNLVHKANLMHNFLYYVFFFSLHVSGNYVPIIRRNNCIYETLGTCYSVWITVWYAGWNEYQSVIHTE